MPRRADHSGPIDRLRAERQVPLGELAGQPLTINGIDLRPTLAVLLRWGRQGKAGVRLDVLFCRRRGCWVTSRPALERFAAELADVVRLGSPDAAA
jgi:hypothetical protein